MEPVLQQQESLSQTEETTTNSTDSSEVNIYPIIRHIFLTLCILLTISIILFLIYQNGKSIYDKGI